MSWGYNSYGGGQSVQYVANDTVLEVVTQLKSDIDDEKLKDIKSDISRLKGMINDKFIIYTQSNVYFGAYIYAFHQGKIKSAASILSALLKKNLSYDGVPLDTLMDAFSPSDFKIILDDILMVHTQWPLGSADVIEKMFDSYPSETEHFIKQGKLNIYEKNRTQVIDVIITKGSADAIIIALNTFYGLEYIKRYGLAVAKVHSLIDRINKKPIDIQIRVRNEFLYTVAATVLPIEILEADYESGLLDRQGITTYTNSMVGNNINRLLRNLHLFRNISLREEIATQNPRLLHLVVETYPQWLSSSIRTLLFM